MTSKRRAACRNLAPARAGMLGGLTVAPLSAALRERFDLPDEITHGVVVTGVEDGSPAQQAGLAPRDGDTIFLVLRN
jgi:S1-C subfamily serine protease